MFLVHCPVCDRRTLLGVDEVEWVHNLAPGMISVTGRCPRGHEATVLTGEALTRASAGPSCRTPRSASARSDGPAGSTSRTAR
ncbi:hypothetical protein FPZ12_015500 [Amycolatopsis acidicola]|uniref:Uncharacterized protein n=1 Tax=Amycolatopsis acidicola TaxID=2596893 RepID=A0A5N0V7H5_9PSEU|nr:hypothetical protein FPZ12_015500 [Amycolatopsis acidicola]